MNWFSNDHNTVDISSAAELGRFSIAFSLWLYSHIKVPTLPFCFINTVDNKEWYKCDIIKNSSYLMLRRDADSNYVFGKPRGGFIIPTIIVENIVEKVIHEGWRVVLHPALNRTENIYSGHILISLDSNQAILEIVGKGFDLSDLSRGDNIPHERWVMNLPIMAYDSSCPSPIDIISHSIISERLYARSREWRLLKIRGWENSNVCWKVNCNNPTIIPASYHHFGYDFFSKIFRNVAKIQHGLRLFNAEPDLYTIGFSIRPECGLFFWNNYSVR